MFLRRAFNVGGRYICTKLVLRRILDMYPHISITNEYGFQLVRNCISDDTDNKYSGLGFTANNEVH